MVTALEEDLDTIPKLLPLLEYLLVEHRDSLTTAIAEWNKSKVQRLQLEEKIIQLDDQQEQKLT